jgi:hypothetical protein
VHSIQQYVKKYVRILLQVVGELYSLIKLAAKIKIEILEYP